jgi:cobalt/nickel transport system permease protein
MHMADALLSPTVGGAFLGVSGGLIAYSARRLGREADERRVPLMGVLGAFVFAAQMINFSIPGTGSSGHLGGGMLLAVLLGPYAAFLVIASVLVVQCLFFLDGGILALGTNIFNLGVWPCFLGLFIYRAIAGRRPVAWRLWPASIVAVVVSLELGALGVVMQTLLSHRVSLPFGRFAALMMGVHLPIAVVEGVITAAVVQYVRAIRPAAIAIGERPDQELLGAPARRETLVPMLVSFLAMTILTGGVVAWFASPRPDGLEWSLARVQRTTSVPGTAPLPSLARFQEKLALMPDYDFRPASDTEPASTEKAASSDNSWPSMRFGTSVAGLLGAGLTFVLICLVAVLLYWFRSRQRNIPSA